MRVVLVCGGRQFGNPNVIDKPRDLTEREVEFVYATLDYVRATRGIDCVVHGGADGADKTAGLWAESRGVPCRVFKANWTLHKKAAGPIRNQRMLDEGKPDEVVAFPGGRGTEDMVMRATGAGVPCFLPAWRG